MTDRTPGSDATGDVWKQWLLHRRNPGDEAKAQADEHFRKIREEVLDNAEVREGETVLDVGTGTGLVAIGALERVGASGRVIFSDISRDCLEHCSSFAESVGMSDRCEFLEAAIEDLSVIPDASVDVVTTRSVLIYSDQKERAFAEFFRVLKPGGRLSMFEPINRFASEAGKGTFWGYDMTPVAELMAKVRAAYDEHNPGRNSAMIDFDERDLVRLAEDAGFQRIGLELKIQVIRGRRGDWDQFLNSAPNPLSLSLQEAVDRALSPEEAATFIDYMKSAFDNNDVSHRSAMAYFVGVKGEG
jgi:ubiquinone/menaquinone biosynthesis C-methylase UbiE